MSRNIGSTRCDFCHGDVSLVEAPRTIRDSEAGCYFEEYRGMLVADAECGYCKATYLAWCCNIPGRDSYCGEPRPFYDLSFRSTFNDEAGDVDRPCSGVISAIHVDRGLIHDRIHLWNRGGKAGVLTIAAGDAAAIVERLAPWITLTFEENG